MSNQLMGSLWRQFDSAYDMLEHSLQNCPDDLWQRSMWPVKDLPQEFSSFWQVAAHVMFWVDLFLSIDEKDFQPPAPFGLEELDPAGKLPRVYTREELLGYLKYLRDKTLRIFLDDQAHDPTRLITARNFYFPYFEVQFESLRHLQEHIAQLALFLGQQAGISANWVAGKGKQIPSI